jgi:hypothetical protein
MNLHSIASNVIAAINPPVVCTLQQSFGYTTGPDGTQSPNYQSFPGVTVQVQALSYSDLAKSGGMNIQGTRRAAYLSGNWEGVDRQALKGGDLLVMPDLPDFPGPTTWLVTQVLEHWSGWVKLAITLQAAN